MHAQLTIVHRRKPEVFSELPPEWRAFVTCLRSLAISFSQEHFDDLRSTDVIFRGENAYRFLLEVACGLQSPIVGETEVFGQFRQFADQWAECKAFFQYFYADVKQVRQAHLSHLGSQSYGSWVRKQINAKTPVHVVGSGQLASEILIWLGKQNSQVTVYSRSPELGLERLRQTVGEAMNRITVRALNELRVSRSDAVIVASPLKAADLLAAEPAQMLIDLRDDSAMDTIATSCERRFSLADIFSEIEKDRDKAKEKIASARTMVDEMVHKRFQSQTYRPFGWDDLCA